MLSINHMCTAIKQVDSCAAVILNARCGPVRSTEHRSKVTKYLKYQFRSKYQYSNTKNTEYLVFFCKHCKICR